MMIVRSKPATVLPISGNVFVMWRDALVIHIRDVCALFYFDWSSLVRCTCVPRTCIVRWLACFYIWTVTNNGDLGLISTQISITPWDVATIVLRQKTTTKYLISCVFLSYDLNVTEALSTVQVSYSAGQSRCPLAEDESDLFPWSEMG